MADREPEMPTASEISCKYFYNKTPLKEKKQPNKQKNPWWNQLTFKNAYNFILSRYLFYTGRNLLLTMCPLNWTFPPWKLHKIPQKIDDSRRQDGNDDRQ